MPGSPPRRWAAAAATLALVAPLAGCGLVPKSRLDQCHQFSKGLQAEVVQLRDQSSKLRAQNEDLVERATTDQRRLAGLETIIARQENGLEALRDDRERLAAELERVLRVVRAPGGDATALRQRLESYAAKHPGVVHEPGSLTCVLPTARLFAPGADMLTPLGRDWLRDLAEVVERGADADMALRLAPSGDAEIVRTSTTPPELPGPAAQVVRAWLVDQGGLPDTAVVVADEDLTELAPGTLEVRFTPRPTPFSLEGPDSRRISGVTREDHP